MPTSPLVTPEDGPDRVVITRIGVRVGDRVHDGQFLFEAETDKISMEVHAPYAGVVVAVHCREGDEMPADAEFVDIRPM